jgi:hypothetical protein
MGLKLVLGRFLRSLVNNIIKKLRLIKLTYIQWRRQNLGGHLRGKLIFWGGKIEFLKRYCYLPMLLSQDFCPPPPQEIRPPLKRG